MLWQSIIVAQLNMSLHRRLGVSKPAWSWPASAMIGSVSWEMSPCCADQNVALLAQAAQAAAAAERSAAMAASGVAAVSLADDDGEDLDPNLYLERRIKALDAAKSAGRRVNANQLLPSRLPRTAACLATSCMSHQSRPYRQQKHTSVYLWQHYAHAIISTAFRPHLIAPSSTGTRTRTSSMCPHRCRSTCGSMAVLRRASS